MLTSPCGQLVGPSRRPRPPRAMGNRTLASAPSAPPFSSMATGLRSILTGRSRTDTLRWGKKSPAVSKQFGAFLKHEQGRGDRSCVAPTRDCLCGKVGEDTYRRTNERTQTRLWPRGFPARIGGEATFISVDGWHPSIALQ